MKRNHISFSGNSRFAMLISASCAALALTLFNGCTKTEQAAPTAAATPNAVSTPETATAAATPTATAPAQAAKVDPGKKPDAVLQLSTDGDNLAFDKTSLTAKAGSTVKLVFKNNSKGSNMSHNWVLSSVGKEADVASEGIQAGDAAGWVQEGPNVLAHTKLTAPGQEDSVVFIAPPAGSYPFLCTYPGHNMTMKGTLVTN